MLICIDEYRQEIHRYVFRAAEVTAPLDRVAFEIDDDDPNDDPPAAVRLAA